MVGVVGVGQEVWVAWGTEVPHNVLESMASLSTSGNWAQTGLAPAGVLGALPQVGEEGHRCRCMFLYSKKQYGCNGEFSIFLFLSYKAHEKCSFFSFQILNVKTQLKPDSTAFYRNTQPSVTLGS